MIEPRSGRKLLTAALGFGLDRRLREDGFSKVASFSWERLSVIDGEPVRDVLIIVPHFGLARSQDSLEVHYRVTWEWIAQTMAQAGLPEHLSRASHIDASVGHLMPAHTWREMNVNVGDTAESLGTSLVAMWATAIRPFADRVRHLSHAAAGPLQDQRLTGPNRCWVRAAAFSRLGWNDHASGVLALLRDQRAMGELDDDVGSKVEAFAELLLRGSRSNSDAP